MTQTLIQWTTVCAAIILMSRARFFKMEARMCIECGGRDGHRPKCSKVDKD